MNELSTKTWALVTRNLGVFNLTPEEAKSAQEALKANAQFLMLEGNMVMGSDIVGVVQGERVKEVKRQRQGDFECPRHPGNWIPKGNKCGYCAY